MRKTYRLLGVAVALSIAANTNASRLAKTDCEAQCLGSEISLQTKAVQGMDLLIRYKNLIAEQLGMLPSEVLMEADFKIDLGADSLDMTEIVMACEKEFSISIPDEAAEKFVYVVNLYDYIREHSHWDI